MSGLPAALVPWQASLGLVQPELVEVLGTWVRRLAAAVGPYRGHLFMPGDEPDGIDGLERRGPLERLLATEWALLDVAPEEFIRRAAMGEQLFLRRALRSGKAVGSCVVLFDAGPEQLGGPRLVHLALWLALSVRADAEEGEFRWGILQDPERALHAGASREAGEALLAARTRVPVSPADLAAWRAVLPSDLGEVWVVSGPGLHLAGARHVRVEDGPDASVEASVEGRPGRVRLPLPPPAVVRQMLHRAFLPPEARPAPDQTEATASFSASGDVLLVRRSAGSVVALPVSEHRVAPWEPLSDGGHAPSGALALGWRGGRACVVDGGDEVALLRLSPSGSLAERTGQAVCLPGAFRRDASRVTTLLSVRRGDREGWVFTDGADRLWALDTDKGRMAPVESVVGALHVRLRQLRYVVVSPSGAYRVVSWSQGRGGGVVPLGLEGLRRAAQLLPVLAHGEPGAWIGAAGHLPDALAVRIRSGLWWVLRLGSATEPVEIQLPAGDRSVGVVHLPTEDGDGELRLVALGADGHTLYSAGAAGDRREITVHAAPVAWAGCSPGRRVLAVLDTRDDVTLFDLMRPLVLAHRALGEG